MAIKLLISALLSSNYIGGTERVILHLLQHLPQEEFNITVALLPDMLSSPFGQAVLASGVTVLPLRDVLSKTDWPGMIRMIKTIRQAAPDLAHVHLTGALANPFLQIAIRLAGVPTLLVTEHTNMILPQRWLGRRRKQFTGQITDVVVAVSQAVKRDLVNHYGLTSDRIVVIENGIEAVRIAQGRQTAHPAIIRHKHHIPSEAFIVGVVAALRYQKGHTYLIDAIPQILTQLSNAIFLLVGDGELRASLEDQARLLGVSDRLIFAGWQADIPAYLSVFNLFLLPSLYEGLPLSILEAMAAGIPIVATAVDGTAEVIEDGLNGRLIPPANPTALAEAVIYMANNPAVACQMALTAQTRAIEHHDVAVMCQKYINLYHQLVHTKS